MPKVYTYNTVIDPISFRDRIEPLTLYKEEYDKQQEAYFKLLEESGDLAKLKDLAMDKDSYDIYEAYTNDINRVADEMGSKGISPETRNALLDLRRRKINEIDPLLKQQKIRADLVKRQDEYIKQHQGAFFDTDYSTTPLSQISDTSTFTPYDPNDILEKSYTTILNNMISNDGESDIDYDSLKDMLGYNNLRDDASRKKFDDVMSLAEDAAKSAYIKYQFKNYIDETRALKLGSRSNGATPKGKNTTKSDVAKPTYDVFGIDYKLGYNKTNKMPTVRDLDGKEQNVYLPDNYDRLSKEDQEKVYTQAANDAHYGGVYITSRRYGNVNFSIIKGRDNNQHYILYTAGDGKIQKTPLTGIYNMNDMAAFRKEVSRILKKPYLYSDITGETVNKNGKKRSVKDGANATEITINTSNDLDGSEYKDQIISSIGLNPEYNNSTPRQVEDKIRRAIDDGSGIYVKIYPDNIISARLNALNRGDNTDNTNSNKKVPVSGRV